MKSFRSKPVGWCGESYRHYLAAKGIKSTLQNVRNTQFVRDDELSKPFEVRDTVEPIPVPVPEDKTVTRSGMEAMRFPKVSAERVAKLRKEGLPLPIRGMDVVDDPNVRMIIGESGNQTAVVVPKSVERFHSSLDKDEVRKALEDVGPSKESLLRKLQHKFRVETDEDVPVELVENVIVEHGVPLHEFAREGVDEKKFGSDVNVTREALFQRFTHPGPAKDALEILEKKGLLEAMENRTVVRGEILDRKPKKGEISEAELLRQTLMTAQDIGGEKAVRRHLKVIKKRLADVEVAGLRKESFDTPVVEGALTQKGTLRKKPPMTTRERVVTSEIGVPVLRDLVDTKQKPVDMSKAEWTEEKALQKQFFDRQKALKELQSL